MMRKNIVKSIAVTFLLIIWCIVFIAGCGKISKLKNSITGDDFTDMAEEYGLDVENRTTSSMTTYIAQGNNIYVEFYIFESDSYIDISYEYIMNVIQEAFSSDDSAETDSNEGAYPRFQMSNDVQNAVVSQIGNTMVYAYATDADGIDNVDEFMGIIEY